MTNKEREALKELKRILHRIKCSPITRGVYNKVKEGLEIATQALAPQECDVTKCQHYEECNHCQLGKLYDDFNFDCRLNPNCYYKQLHSQQKTFIIKEIKQILHNYKIKELLNCDEWGNDCMRKLSQEFEKEVNNEKS